jgi:predicted AAA+ superfamily ATPase
LFIDEIQECPEAIALLRYFYEDLPQLHVIAAGSLLEHVLGKVKSFPVGRVSYLYVHPLNFLEYLNAKQQHLAKEAIDEIPVKVFAHQTLKDLFHEYAIIGGMPEIIETYLTNNSVADLPEIYESIWSTYKEDVEKYAQNLTATRVIRHIMDTAHLYIDQRVKFQNFGNSNYKSREVGEALRNLNDARVIQLIYPTTSIVPPIKLDFKKSPRLQFLDTGLVNYELNIQGNMLALEDLDTAYKGAIIPHLITQELISLNTTSYHTPNFWVREKAQASSEVDLVLQFKDKIIPVEIKSGKAGKLKSLHQFLDRSSHPYAIRLYSGMFSVEKHITPMGKTPYLLMNLPYYLGTKLEEYINYFITHYEI